MVITGVLFSKIDEEKMQLKKHMFKCLSEDT